MSLESNFSGCSLFLFTFWVSCCRSCCVVDVNGTTFISSYLRSGMERENNVWPLDLSGDSTHARIFKTKISISVSPPPPLHSTPLTPPKTVLSRFISFLKLSRIIVSSAATQLSFRILC